MSIGSSGRIVIEIDPDFKRELYKILKKDGVNLKQWFLEVAERRVSDHASSLALDEKTGSVEGEI